MGPSETWNRSGNRESGGAGCYATHRLITAHDSHTAWLNVSLMKAVIPGCVHTEVLRSAGGQCVCITLPLLVIVDH